MRRYRYLFIMFLLILSVITDCYAQQITLQLYGKYSCNGNISPIEIYSLTKNSVTVTTLFGETPIVLPDTGMYILKTADVFEPLTIYVNKIGENKDTIQMAGIVNIVTLRQKPTFSGWLCCGEKCDGYQVDYYNSGKVRIEGFFKKGKPIKELKLYNPDGSLFQIEYYDKKGRKIKVETFDKVDLNQKTEK